jgi:uncharacterized membrane protein
MAEYRIPLKYRKMENLHIVFWLLKDIGWCMIWKPLGIIMICPTLVISIVIAYRTRQMFSAITFWITANSYWMISEFIGFDSKHVYHSFTYKHLSLIPFLTGLGCLLYYYVIWQPRHPYELDTM